MEKNIKDYLHLYLGCEAQWRDIRNPEDEKVIGELIEIGNNMATIEAKDYEYYECTPEEVKPILRPLSSMTEKERIEFAVLKDVHWDGNLLTVQSMGVITHWLLSKHFDLFGLIEAGLAIDATILAPTNA